MKTYGTYRFKDKDPVIDIARTCVQIYAGLREINMPKAIQELAKTSNVSPRTIEKWFSGDTTRPAFCTVAAVVIATGEGIKIGKHVVGSHRYRVIPGGKAKAAS